MITEIFIICDNDCIDLFYFQIFQSSFSAIRMINGPVHEIPVLIVTSSSEGSVASAHIYNQVQCKSYARVILYYFSAGLFSCH